jgi:hypothetical protein
MVGKSRARTPKTGVSTVQAKDMPAVTTRTQRWLDAADRQTLLGALAAKAIVLLFGLLAYSAIADKAVAGPRDALALWNRWDAPHYLSIARDGYQTVGEDRFLIVFFPLYPLAIRLVSLLVVNELLAAFIVSGVASLAAALLLRRLALLDGTAEFASRAVWFLLIFPTSYFLQIGYTESLFIALILGAFLAARHERWALAGCLGALACLTRINGLLLLPAFAVEVALLYRARGQFRREWLWIGLPVVGILGYLLLNRVVYGDPLQFLHYQREHWYKSFDWPWNGIGGSVRSIGWRTPADAQLVGVQETLFIALGFGGAVATALLLRPSYAIWMFGNWLLFTSTAFVLSVPRYTLTLFPLYLLFARLAAGRTWFLILTVWSLLFMALFVTLFVQGRWAF